MLSYYDLTQLNDDKCAIATDIEQNVKQFKHMTYYGYIPETIDDYVNKITPHQLRQRQYWNGIYYVDMDTYVTHAPMTHNGAIRELYGRPFKTQPYRGASRRSIDPKIVDLESALTFGTYTETKKLGDPVHQSGVNRFIPLPEYGNPQRVDRVVLPTTWGDMEWAQGGTDTRDNIRRVSVQHVLGTSYVPESTI